MKQTTPFILILLVAGGVFGLSGGCWSPPQHVVSEPPLPDDPAERSFEEIWRGCRDVLRRYDFPIQWQDRRLGVMSTKAVSSGHLMEAFWRKDNPNMFSLRENAVQNVFRAVRITLRRINKTNRYEFAVQVAMARSDRGSPQLTDASQVSRGRGDLTKKQKKLYEKKQQQITYTFADLTRQPPRTSLNTQDKSRAWPLVPLGFDHDLAMRISRKITARTGANSYLIDQPKPADSDSLKSKKQLTAEGPFAKKKKGSSYLVGFIVSKRIGLG